MCGRATALAMHFDAGPGSPASPVRDRERDLLSAHRLGVT